MSYRNQYSYNAIANKFSAGRKLSKVNDLVIRFSNLLPNNSVVLDVGCGTGIPNDKYLSEKGFAILGVDISSKLLSESKQNIPSGRFIEVDIVDFHTDKNFKGILAWDSLFHLELNEHELVFRKLYDLLEKDGYLLFTYGAGKEGQITSKMFEMEFYYSTLGTVRIKNLLKEIGFEIVNWEVEETDKNYLICLVKK